MTFVNIIEASRQKVAINVNRELTLMYWSIGERINKEVLQNQRAEYGKAIVSTLSTQLQDVSLIQNKTLTLSKLKCHV